MYRTQQRLIEEQSICGACGGSGQELNLSMTAGLSLCRRCQGAGYIVTKRTVTTTTTVTPNV